MQYDIKVTGISELKKRFSNIPRMVEKAEVSALNKIADQGRTEAKRRIREVYNIKTGDLSGKALRVIGAKGGGTVKRFFATIVATGKLIPLYKFQARPMAPRSQKGVKVKKRKPVTVKVLKAGSRKPVARAFLAKVKSGDVGIFRRKGIESLPIKKAYGPGIPNMFKKYAIPALNRIISTKGLKIFQNRLSFYLGQLKGKM